MRALLQLMVLLILPSVTWAQSRFTRINPPGPHPVGLRVVEQYDWSRGYRGATDPYTGKAVQGERARPIQTLIWYPAKPGTGRATTAGDYLRLAATSEDFGRAKDERARMETAYVQEQVSALTPARARAELGASMLARRDASASTGQYPVIIYAPSFGAPAFENADLCEYLASLGYLVLASPSIGQWAGGMTTDLEGVEAQMGDIQYLIGYAHHLPQANTNHLAVIGYSWGGLANVMAAAKDPRIDALVALDGSVRYWPNIIEQSRFLTPQRITVPLLYIAAKPDEVEDQPADVNMETSFLNRMRYADLYRVTLAPYVHRDFSVMFGQRFAVDGGDGDSDSDELSTANGWMERYVQHFLDGYLKNDVAGRAFLDLPATKTGAPAHLLTVYRTKSQGPPPTRAAFAAELARAGFDHAAAIYQDFRKRDSSFTVSEPDLNAWGYKLLRDHDAQSSVAILRFAADLNPNSWNAFDSLGDAYAATESRDLAIAAYRKSLALNPDNAHAAAQLAKLGASR